MLTDICVSLKEMVPLVHDMSNRTRCFLSHIALPQEFLSLNVELDGACRTTE